MGVEKNEPHFLQEEEGGFFNDYFLKECFWNFPRMHHFERKSSICA